MHARRPRLWIEQLRISVIPPSARIIKLPLQPLRLRGGRVSYARVTVSVFTVSYSQCGAVRAVALLMRNYRLRQGDCAFARIRADFSFSF